MIVICVGLIYMAIGFIASIVGIKVGYCKSKDGYYDDEQIVAVMIFWPIFLIFSVIYLSGKCLIEASKLIAGISGRGIGND